MPPKKKEAADDDAARLRVAIINSDRCKPKKCRQECKKSCPVNRTGKFCIEVEKTDTICKISESLCIGCGICVKKCPFEAIQIINLPKDLGKETSHRYGPNTFKLHRLPTPRPGQVLGLMGCNGMGKSTALKILGGTLKPNLGNYENPPSWKQIQAHYRGSELQSFFERVLEGHLVPALKPQYVDLIPKKISGQVQEIIDKRNEGGTAKDVIPELDLSHLLERQLADLSGGELQRFSIAIVCISNANIYMFDEPSSYLDVRQRLNAARSIRKLVKSDNYVICVEHDLSVLDYLSDFVCCLWGTAGGYGVVTMPFSVREGINIFLDGFIPTENMRFREVSLSFKVSVEQDVMRGDRVSFTSYPALRKTMQSKQTKFILNVEAGQFSEAEIIVMLGQNGCGKTTFIRMLAGVLVADKKEGEEEDLMPKLNVSYKPQTISAKFEGTVRDLLLTKIRDAFQHPQFQSDVVKPMLIEQIADQNVQNLSGGELQRVAIVLALGKPADIYLIDEPSAYLDVEQRIVAARVIKRYILHSNKTAFIVEHDFIMSAYLADRIVVYSGEPGVECTASSPQNLAQGMNKFLAQLEITFRRDPTNYRPRINKMDSVKDREQKQEGNYYNLEE